MFRVFRKLSRQSGVFLVDQFLEELSWTKPAMGIERETYVEVFCILPDGTILHVILLGVLEAEFEVLSDCVEAGVLSGFYPRLDFVESNWILNLLVIIRVLTF
jgi:hypothetical protein